MSRTFFYQRPSDNLIATLSPVVTVLSGAVESGYGSTYLSDFSDANIGRPMRFTTTTARIQIDFGAPVAVPLLVVWHNFDQGLNVRWQGTNGGSPLEFDAAVTINAKTRNGFTYKPFLEVSAQPNYAAYRYWILDIPTNSVPVGVKLWLGGAIRQLQTDFQPGLRSITSQADSGAVTDAGAEWHYKIPSRLQRLDGSVLATDAEMEEIRDWFDEAGSDVCVLIPDPEINRALFVRWASAPGSGGVTQMRMEETLEPSNAQGYRQVSVAFSEASGGGPEWL